MIVDDEVTAATKVLKRYFHPMWEDDTWHRVARQVLLAGPGQGRTGPGAARQGAARHSMAGRGRPRPGTAWPGTARHGEELGT